MLDAYSRKIIGWSIDSTQDTRLVINALDMAIRNRDPAPGAIVHADHGAQFTSWAFGDRIRRAGLMPSFGSVGDGRDNAMMESFWSSMQIELLNRQRWNTRVEFELELDRAEVVQAGVPSAAVVEDLDVLEDRVRTLQIASIPA